MTLKLALVFGVLWFAYTMFLIFLNQYIPWPEWVMGLLWLAAIPALQWITEKIVK